MDPRSSPCRFPGKRFAALSALASTLAFGSIRPARAEESVCLADGGLVHPTTEGVAAPPAVDSGLPVPDLARTPPLPLPPASAFALPPLADEPRPTATGSTDLEDHAYWRRNLFKRVVSDQKFLITTWWPAEARNSRFAMPMLVGVAAAASSGGDGVDQNLESSVKDRTAGGSRGIAHGFTTLGNASTAGLLLGSVYLIGRFRGNERATEAASLSTEALLDAGIYIVALKSITARTRPASGGKGDFFEYKPEGRQSNGSFPSGHATGAFAVATVFAHQYEDKKWVPWVAYSTAGLIAASRVVLGRHFPSDVVVGAVLGNSIGRMVVVRARGGQSSTPWRLGPIFDPDHGGYGLAWNRSW